MKQLATVAILIAAALASAQVVVTKVQLAKDNGRGKPGQVVSSISPSDQLFHCVVNCKPLKVETGFSGTLVALDAGGHKDYRVASVSLNASANMDLVDFKFSLPRPWPVGKYRIDVKADGRMMRSVSFEIK